jgi:predicted transcriptional regulator
MKSVLISIQPKWCEFIASGKKTVEVRKTKPKLEVPFKCYIYCTKDNTFAEKTLRGFDNNGKAIYFKANKGKVIGEFVCDKIDYIGWISNPAKLDWKNYYDKNSCLTSSQLYDYSNGGCYYEWHISDLVIYDKPKELSEFKKPCNHKNDCCTCDRYDYIGHRCYDEITRPPQSWCYVEGDEGK